MSFLGLLYRVMLLRYGASVNTRLPVSLYNCKFIFVILVTVVVAAAVSVVAAAVSVVVIISVIAAALLLLSLH